VLPIVLALLAQSSAPAAQRLASEPKAAGTVEGVVTRADGRAAAAARVFLVGAAHAASDASGRFRFADVPPGGYTLRAELEGLGRDERDIEVRPGTTTEVELKLPFVPFSEAVTVTATRSERKLGDSPVDLAVITGEELQRSPASALDDALRQIPAFSLFRRGSSLVSHPTTQGVSLRGVGASGASRTLVLLDGIPLNDAFGNWVYWDVIPQLEIESVEVAPSGLSSLYGSSAMAGVIDITTRRPGSKTAALQASAGARGTADAQAFASHALGPVAASVGGNLFTTDGYVLVGEGERGPVDVAAGSRHRSFNWRAEYSPAEGLTFYQAGRVFEEDRRNGTPLQTNSTSERFLAAGVRAATAGGSLWQANLFGRRDHFESTFSTVAPDRTSESLGLAQAVAYRDVGARLSWARRLGSSQQLSAGGEAHRIGADDAEHVFVAPAVNVRDRQIPARQLSAGVYLQDVVSLGPRAVLTLAARADHWRSYDASQTETVNATGATTTIRFADGSNTTLTPRAGLLVHLDARFALRGAVYGGFRAPSLNELYRPFRVGNVLTQANPGLGPERLRGGEFGLNHFASASVSWRATAFWDEVRDPIANVTVSSTPGLITRRRENLGRSRVRGLDLDLDWQPSPEVRLQASYLLSDARVVEFAAARELEGNRLPQVPRNRASLRLDFLRPRLLNVSLRARYESTRFDDDQNRLPLAGLFVVDAVLERRVAGSWSAFLSAENVFDRRYAVQATPVGLLGGPILVTAGLRFGPRR
jgi:outer membrane receptor protein involved in Fe transport